MNKLNKEHYDNYEDALFALLMDHFADDEGARIIEENIRIKDDPGYNVPAEIYKSCKRTITNAFSAKEKAEKKRRIKKNLLRVAVVMIVFTLVFSGMYFSVSAMRESISSMLKDLRDAATVLFVGESTEIDGAVDSLSPENPIVWKPEGFTLNTYSVEGNIIYADYYDDSGNQLVYKAMSGSVSSSVDTEDADSVKKIDISGNEGLLIEKGDTISITWFDPSRNITIRIKAQGIDRETLINLANSA